VACLQVENARRLAFLRHCPGHLTAQLLPLDQLSEQQSPPR